MFDDLQINPDRIPLYKLILHVAQIGFSFVAWILAIVVFRAKNSSVSGPNGWAFGVVRWTQTCDGGRCEA